MSSKNDFDDSDDWDDGNLDLKLMEGPEGDYTEPLVLVSRQEWGALPPTSDPVPVKHPVTRVCYTFSAHDDTCTKRDECYQVLRQLQQEHMDQGMSDIAYNFLVGRDGTVYEGRGWNAKSSKSLKHNPRLYDKRLDIGFIGDYSTDMIPPVDMLEGAINLAVFGMENKFIREPYRVVEIRNWRERRRAAIMERREAKRKEREAKEASGELKPKKPKKELTKEEKEKRRFERNWGNVETDIEKILPGCLKRIMDSKNSNKTECDDEECDL